MSKPEKINYSLPSGFDIEFLPGEKRLEQQFLDTIRGVFECYGFAPIETPAVERLAVLQAKGSQGDNIIYGITPLVANSDEGDIDRGLKFDQTLPLAAYIARHLNDLTFPFARYQMDMVFRGERAKAGRYRQFRQCDIDVVGRGKLDLLYDAQMPAIIAEIFTQLNIGQFLIRINNRKVLTGFLLATGIAPELARACINTVDELDKIGLVKVQAALEKLGVTAAQAQAIIDFTQIQGSPDEVLAKLTAIAEQREEEKLKVEAKRQAVTELLGDIAELSEVLKRHGIDDELPSAAELFEGIAELQEVIAGVRALQVPADQFCIDLSIARGLGYYTGTVYETTLLGYESLGSICSGGRYAELVGLFAGEELPGVGISIGLTRLIKNLLKEKLVQPLAPTPAQVVVMNLDRSLMASYLQISQQLRQAGIATITNFESSKLGDQLKKAEKLGISIAIIQGATEQAAGKCQVKVLATREQLDVNVTEIVQAIQNVVSIV
jgi:histidyl-tRNA synthetase